MSVKLHPGVDTWDARLTPLLDDEQRQLIASLAATPYEPPYPPHLMLDSSKEPDTAGLSSSEVDQDEMFDLKEPVESLLSLETWFKGIQESMLDEKEMQFFITDTAGLSSSEVDQDEMFDLKEPVESLLSLETWFKGIQESMLDEKEMQLSELKENCASNLKIVDELLNEVRESQSDIRELNTVYNQVSHQTNALHTSCEKLLEEESELMSGVCLVSEKLNYFSEYDRIMQKLNSPVFSAKSASFNNLLQSIEECILYLSDNPHYKESGNYLLLYKSAHTKALVLMKQHFQTTLTTAAQVQQQSNSFTASFTSASSSSNVPRLPSLPVADLSPGGKMQQVEQSSPNSAVTLASGGGGANNSFSVLYGKFRAISSSMKIVVEQLEERQTKYLECQQILEDCENIYFSARQALVGPSVVQGVNDLLIRHKGDHCGLFRNGTFMILQVCVDEWDLFQHFFSHPTERLASFLQSLCNHLYDALRPLIVHIVHLETLSELCTILKSEMLGDKVLSMKERIGVLELTCKQMLEDIQERLVYRTQMYIRSDILGYSPVPGDLAYPQKLIMMRQIAESISQQNQQQQRGELSSDGDISSAAEESVDDVNKSANIGSASPSVPLRRESVISKRSTGSGGGGNDISPADMHGMWYPTLRRTLVCLSKLYRCLDIDIFRGLAQETLGCCVQSLLFAANQIKANKSLMDSQLFFIKHLLILREQIQPFHSEFFVTETVLDFSKTRLAALGLLSKRERLFSLSRSNALLQFLIDGSPQVTELTVDSKKDVDMQLKKHCEVFVENCCKALCEPLMQFMEKAKVIIELKKEGQSSNSKVALRTQPFANAKKLQDIVGATNKLIKTQLPPLKDKMSLYLANRDTEAILFRPVMTKVIKTFNDARQLLQTYYTEEDAQIIGLPSVEEVKLLLA